MLALLKMLDARLSEPSTYAGLSAILLALNVNIDPGVMHQVTLYGTILSGVLAVILSEIGNKPPMQIAIDVIEALASGLKTVAPPSTPVAPAAPAAVVVVPPAAPAVAVAADPAPVA